MNDDAYDSVMELWERAKAFGGATSEHFLFPACEHGHIDPERHQKSWRTAWPKLTKAAGLQGFRFHDCRHHAITELAESQASDSTTIRLRITAPVSLLGLTPSYCVRLKCLESPPPTF